jgi:hypothetical protein
MVAGAVVVVAVAVMDTKGGRGTEQHKRDRGKVGNTGGNRMTPLCHSIHNSCSMFGGTSMSLD